MNHHLQFGDGQLVSLFSSSGRLSEADQKNVFILGELAASLQVASIEETRCKYTFVDSCSPALAVRYVASLFWPFTIFASLPSVVCKTRWTHQAPHKSAGRVAVNTLPTRHS